MPIAGLDFRLAEGTASDGSIRLKDVLKGHKDPQTLYNRLEAQRNRALNRGEIGRYLMTFVDNHDSFWQSDGRFGNDASDEQIIGAIGYLLCSLGTAVIYYGTEQGFFGRGGDIQMREAMFRKDKSENLLNTQCRIYRGIAQIAGAVRHTEPLRFGRMYYREISADGKNFGLPFGVTYTLAFSRLLYPREVLVAYNVAAEDRHDRVVVDAELHPDKSKMQFLHPQDRGTVDVETAPNGARFVRLDLAPHEFVILE